MKTPPARSIFQRISIYAAALLFLSLAGAAQAVQPEILHEFQFGPANPAASLTLGPDGNLYGTTAHGGHGYGTIFKVNTNGVWTTLFAFDGTNGSYPSASLTLGPDGNFFGTTCYDTRTNGRGNVTNFGTIFKVSTNGVLNTLDTFNTTNVGAPSFFEYTNGAFPLGSLALGSDGSLYGTSYRGGSGNGVTPVFFSDGLPQEFNPKFSSEGTFYKVTTNGLLTILASFDGTNGIYPRGDLALGSDGAFYGTTAVTNVLAPGSLTSVGYGTVFRATTNGVVTTFATFNVTNGAYPFTGLTLGPDGNFYGTTPAGGANQNARGAVFRLATNGVISTVATFYITNGAAPNAKLTLGPDGNFYGTTVAGGLRGFGTIFRVTTGGALTILASFDQTNGASPMAALTLAPNGKLYGTTYVGGDNDTGTVFSLDTNGVLTSLASFDDAEGTQPMAGLTIGPDGAFYGSTFQGGTNGNHGTVFKVTMDGNFTSLASFNSKNGAEPAANLTLAPDGNFYGTTFSGGASSNGTIFQFTPTGSINSLVSFNGADGAQPESALIPAGNGGFYGTASSGGESSNGTVFEVTTNGGLLVLVSFNYTNGAGPDGGLTLGPNGLLYGVTSQGGTNGYGTVFEMTTNGDVTSLQSLNHTNGAFPEAPLLLGPDGNFYGTTSEGGVNARVGLYGPPGPGAFFRMTPAGRLTELASMDPVNTGECPEGALVFGPDGRLYGTTAETSYAPPVREGYIGDQSLYFDYGKVFSVTTNGSTSLAASFNGTNGANSYAPLVLAADGNFYGTAYRGGNADAGVIFRIGNPPYISQQPAGSVNFSTGAAQLSVSAVGGLPLSYQWLHNGSPLQDGATISGSATTTLSIGAFTTTNLGEYSIVVTNYYGAITSSIAALSISQPGASLVLNLQTSGPPGDQTNSITFAGVANSPYTLQFATNIAGPWFDLTPGVPSSAGLSTNIDATATNSQRFYRIKY